MFANESVFQLQTGDRSLKTSYEARSNPKSIKYI